MFVYGVWGVYKNTPRKKHRSETKVFSGPQRFKLGIFLFLKKRALEDILQPAFAKASAGTASSQGRCLLLSLTKYQDERTGYKIKLFYKLIFIQPFNFMISGCFISTFIRSIIHKAWEAQCITKVFFCFTCTMQWRKCNFISAHSAHNIRSYPNIRRKFFSALNVFRFMFNSQGITFFL